MYTKVFIRLVLMDNGHWLIFESDILYYIER